MAAKRAERLVNLVIALLGTRQYVTAARIRATVPGYEPDDGTDRADEAFKRMFERDKAELRELGIPLETGRNSHFDSEDGYRIRRGDYELPTIEFDAAEAAAVGLAARLWQSATLGEPARQALIKLRAAVTYWRVLRSAMTRLTSRSARLAAMRVRLVRHRTVSSPAVRSGRRRAARAAAG